MKLLSNLLLLCLAFMLLWLPDSLNKYTQLELVIFTCTGSLIMALQIYQSGTFK